ncbi:MAG TPA: methyltransferase type 11, partial [Hanamia sp.]
CRMGFMFFPDMLLAAKEIYRVLKPGGRFATAVWGVPEKNFWVTAVAGTINKNMQLPAPQPGALGMFRCAKSGLMMDIFNQAGFKNTSEKEVKGKLKSETAAAFWTMTTEIAAPFAAALNKADDVMKEKIKEEVYELVIEKYSSENITMVGSAIVIYGEK